MGWHAEELLLRKLGHLADPACFALHSSRGHEGVGCKALGACLSELRGRSVWWVVARLQAGCVLAQLVLVLVLRAWGCGRLAPARMPVCPQVFLRLSVIVSDLLVYLPGSLCC